jgi:methanethiol S-methyltransferase
MKYLLIAILWSAYCVLHSYLISISFTNLMTRLLKNYYAFYRLFYVLISLFLLIPLINFSNQLDHQVIITYAYPFSIIRYVLIWSSLFLFFWAFFFNYDSLTFFGFRQILNFKKTEEMNSSKEIKKSGLLGYMRHPMYFFLIIYLLCQTQKLADIVVNIVLIAYIVIATRLEEKKLILEFGDTYIKYQQEVPMLIPFTKRKAANKD